jgi:hypothetical protein
MMSKMYHLLGVMLGGSRHILGVYDSPEKGAAAVHNRSYRWTKYRKLILVTMCMEYGDLKEELIDCWEQQFVSTYVHPESSAVPVPVPVDTPEESSDPLEGLNLNDDLYGDVI